MKKPNLGVVILVIFMVLSFSGFGCQKQEQKQKNIQANTNIRELAKIAATKMVEDPLQNVEDSLCNIARHIGGVRWNCYKIKPEDCVKGFNELLMLTPEIQNWDLPENVLFVISDTYQISIVLDVVWVELNWKGNAEEYRKYIFKNL